MLFNSFVFPVFLVLVLVGYRLLPWSWARWWLVAASYVFYGWAIPWYCLLLLASTLVDFFVAPRIEAAENPRRRKQWLLVSLVANLGLLASFKYADFVVLNGNFLLDWFGLPGMDPPNLLLPVGISFYTFQTLAYTIDVYRREQKATRDFAAFALYVSFFPQLVAGPIERAYRLLPQLQTRQPVSIADWEYGFQRILWGLVKKLVFADRLAIMVNEVYGAPELMSAPVLIIATLGFGFQLYLDFSAYTDIAIGTARLLGVRLVENFNWPFTAINPGQFWARWHMSLTTWFRDYPYRALGGTMRGRPFRTVFNILLVFSLMGLWHGASWHFVLFGFLGGLTLAVWQILRIATARIRRPGVGLLGDYWWSTPLSWVIGIPIIGSLMVVFRSPDLQTMATVFYRIAGSDWAWQPKYYPFLAMVVGLYLFQWARARQSVERGGVAMPPVVRGAFWTVLLLLIVFGAVDRADQFIYFQF